MSVVAVNSNKWLHHLTCYHYQERNIPIEYLLNISSLEIWEGLVRISISGVKQVYHINIQYMNEPCVNVDVRTTYIKVYLALF